MNWYALSGLFNFVTSTVVASLIWLRGKHTEWEITFTLFCANMGIWSVFYFLWHLARDADLALIYVRGLMMGAIFIPFFLFHFVTLLTGVKHQQRFWIWGGYLCGCFLALSNLGNGVVVTVEPRLHFPYWPVPGPLFHLHLFSFALYVFRFTQLLFISKKTATGVRREQIKYLLYGSLIGFGGGMTNYPLWYNIPIKPIGNGLVAIYVSIIGYTILRYRLMDINLAFRNITIMLIFAIALTLPSVTVLYLSHSLSVGYLLLVGEALLGPFLFVKLKEALSSAVDSLPPFRGKYLSFNALQRSLHEINQANSLQDWQWRLVKVLREIYVPRRVVILVRDEHQKYFLVKAGFGLDVTENVLLSIVFDSPIIEFFERERAILVKENLRMVIDSNKQELANQDMIFVHASVCVPIFNRGDLRAIVCLDEKENGEMYNNLDLANLGSLARGAEHALQSILSGLSHEQLTAVWAHDLLKPFTSKGSFRFISEMLNGSFGNINQEIQSALELIKNDVVFVSKNLGRILSPGEGDVYDKKPSPLTNAYLRIKEKYIVVAAESRAQWKVKAPPTNIQVYCDMPIIEHRVLANLVENAFRYTPPGGTVELSYELKDKNFIGYVRDTGIGIRKEDFVKVFKRGSQLDVNNKGLAGLGLFSVKTVTEGHGGKVWFESDFGKGSTFYFELPLVEK